MEDLGRFQVSGCGTERGRIAMRPYNAPWLSLRRVNSEAGF
jgi:hypothetical protein